MRLLALEVDIGTVTSAILDATSAQPIGEMARVRYVVDRPTPVAAEVSGERLWSAVTTAARSVSQAVEGIEGVGLSVVSPALVLIEKKDQPAAPVRLPHDRRSRPAARQVEADVGAEFLAEIGNRSLPGSISAVAFRQMVADDPYLIREVRRYLHLNSWLAFRMTGETAFDRANASLSGLCGTLTTGQWSPRWCEYFEVELAWLPPIVDGSATVGTIRSAIAAELGVPAGLPLKLGTNLICTSILAAGMSVGDLLHVEGDTQLLATITDRSGPESRRMIFRRGVGDGFVRVALNPISVAALRWLHSLCFREQSDHEFHEYTIPQARERATRITLDPAALGGDCLEIDARRAAFRDLTLATDRLDLLAAFLRAMRQQHENAIAALGLGGEFRRIFVIGMDAELVRGLTPTYAAANLQLVDAPSLRGVACLFQP
jgi:sugar (pentulose or hexulose) kinase